MCQSIYRAQILASFRDVMSQHKPICEPPADFANIIFSRLWLERSLMQYLKFFPKSAAPVEDDHSIDLNLLSRPCPHGINVIRGSKVKLAPHESSEEHHLGPKFVLYDVRQGRYLTAPRPRINALEARSAEEPKLHIAMAVALPLCKRAVHESRVKSFVGKAKMANPVYQLSLSKHRFSLAPVKSGGLNGSMQQHWPRPDGKPVHLVSRSQVNLRVGASG